MLCTESGLIKHDSCILERCLTPGFCQRDTFPMLGSKGLIEIPLQSLRNINILIFNVLVYTSETPVRLLSGLRPKYLG